MTMNKRAEWYKQAFPKFPELRIFNGRIEDLWFLGNDYTNTSNYYGAYPKGYLKRMNVLFQDKKEILHLFSGKLPDGDYIRFDRTGNPDVMGDAENLEFHLRDHNLIGGNATNFDCIFADPPYSQEDANHYGTCLIKRNTVVKECQKVLQKGGYLIWLDQVFPMFSKREWKLTGMIGIIEEANIIVLDEKDWKLAGSIEIVISTNHRARIATILERL